MDVEISRFLHREESDELEYKLGFEKDDFASTVAAFSTTRGGIILIGVRDDGIPVGFTKPQKFEEMIQDIAKSVDGIAAISISCHKYPPEKEIVAVRVSEGDKKPYGWKGVHYERRGKNDYRLSSDEIFRIKLRSLNLTFDLLKGYVSGREATIADIDETKIKDFVERMTLSKRNRLIQYRDAKHTLNNLDLISENGHQPKNAALFFFARDLKSSFPSARINFLVYRGDEISEDYRERQYVYGTLIEQLDATYRLFRQYTESKVVVKDLKRIEVTQYPLLAIREALINAVAHRDYSVIDSEIVVRIFKNKMEITNPGGLVEGVNLEELRKGGHDSKRRNPILCKLFDDIGYMEQSGQGITNMINQMRGMGLKEPIIEADRSHFKILFEGQRLEGDIANSPTARVADLEKLLNERQKKALDFIQKQLDEKSGIAATEYVKKFKVSIITAMSDLRMFQRIGVLKGSKVGRSRVYFKSN